MAGEVLVLGYLATIFLVIGAFIFFQMRKPLPEVEEEEARGAANKPAGRVARRVEPRQVGAVRVCVFEWRARVRVACACACSSRRYTGERAMLKGCALHAQAGGKKKSRLQKARAAAAPVQVQAAQAADSEDEDDGIPEVDGARARACEGTGRVHAIKMGLAGLRLMAGCV